MEYGAFDYLTKPADIDLLTYKINEAILFGGGTKRDQEMVVGDLMIPIGEYVVLGPDATLEEAIVRLRDASLPTENTDKLLQTGHREVLVVDKGGILGMISMKEIVNAVRPTYLDKMRNTDAGTSMRYSHIFWNGMLTMRLKEMTAGKLRDIMVPPPPPIDKNANLMEVCDLMHETSARRLMVTEGKSVVGVIREQELFLEMIRIITK